MYEIKCNKIEVGTPLTQYDWFGKFPYEVVKVIDQARVFVRAYDVEQDGRFVSNEYNTVVELVLDNGEWYRASTHRKFGDVCFGVAELYYAEKGD